MAIPQKNEGLTYADYLAMGDEVRCEVIDGQVYNMSPAPTPKHQAVQRELLTEFSLFLRGKTCRVFGSPIDVCFSEESNDINKIKEWVEPDIVIVCDRSKIHEKRIVGVPDLIVEILSPSTSRKDKRVKFQRYEREGVQEYWIVDPSNETVDGYVLNETVYKHVGTFFRDDQIPVTIFDGFSIPLSQVFNEAE